MADTKLTGLTENTDPQDTDIMYMVDDPSGSPDGKKIEFDTMRSYFVPPSVVEGRLTLTSNTPVTTSDVTGTATLYFSPYMGDKVGLYNGSKWEVFEFTEKSLSLSGYTANKNYDIWLYDNAGTLTLDSTIWTDDTNRATALTTQNGIYVKNGDATRRYLGTIRINSAGGLTEDNITKRFVWNYYNRIEKTMKVVEATSHNYTTTSTRAWNNDTSVKVEFVLGISDDIFLVGHSCQQETSLSGIGYDTFTSTIDLTDIYIEGGSQMRVFNNVYHRPNLGYHYYGATERGYAGATQNSIGLIVLGKF